MATRGSQTRERILDASESLFLENGYAATSIEGIIGQVGVTKGTFFYHFPSKQDLARALIDRYAAADAEHLHGYMARAAKLSSDPVQRLLVFVGLFQEGAEALTEPYPGCLFASYCYESGQLDPGSLQVVSDTMREWRRVLGGAIQEAIDHHPPRMPVDADSLADAITVVFEGAFIMARVLKEPRLFADQLRHYRNYLELLFA